MVHTHNPNTEFDKSSDPVLCLVRMDFCN